MSSSSPIEPVLLMKPQPVLSDMPEHIKEKIIALLDTITKLKLGQCSKNFKKLVDKSSFHFKQLAMCLFLNSTMINVYFDDEPIKSISFKQNSDEDIKQAVEFISKILKTKEQVPVTMNTLAIYHSFDEDKVVEIQDRYSKLMDCLQETLASRKHQLCVKELTIQLFEDREQKLSKVLLHLEPIFLEKINLDSSDLIQTEDDFIIFELGNAVLESRQWKGAKELFAFDCHLNISYEQYEHFEGIVATVEDAVTLEQLKSLIEKSFKMPVHVSKKIVTEEEMEFGAMRNYLKQFECHKNSYIVPIPGTQDRLHVELHEHFDTLVIRKDDPDNEDYNDESDDSDASDASEDSEDSDDFDDYDGFEDYEDSEDSEDSDEQ